MARAANQATTTTLEQRLRDAAGALHGKQEPSEYQHVALGLVFLTYISDRVGDRRAHNPGIEMDWIPTPRSEPLPVAQRGTLKPMALRDGLLPEHLPGRIRVRDAELAES